MGFVLAGEHSPESALDARAPASLCREQDRPPGWTVQQVLEDALEAGWAALPSTQTDGGPVVRGPVLVRPPAGPPASFRSRMDSTPPLRRPRLMVG